MNIKTLNKIAIVIFITVLVVFLLLAKDKFFPKKEAHYHAGFVVFKDDQKIDLSDNKYMNTKPCTTSNVKTNEDPQIEKAHLHDNIGDVVHVEYDGAKWQDLFTNIKYSLDYNRVTAYINGKLTPNFQNQLISPDDDLILLIGVNKINHLSQRVTKAHINQVGSASKTCGD